MEGYGAWGNLASTAFFFCVFFFVGVVFQPLIIKAYVLGSKLPIFPYNRGWSSTQ